MAKIILTEEQLKEVIKCSLNENQENEILGSLLGAGIILKNKELKTWRPEEDDKGHKEKELSKEESVIRYGTPKMYNGKAVRYGIEEKNIPSAYKQFSDVFKKHIVGVEDTNKNSPLEKYLKQYQSTGYNGIRNALNDYLPKRDEYFNNKIYNSQTNI